MAEKKKKEKKVVHEGMIYIQATFNNTIVSATDMNGNVLAWSSAGALNFKGAKKSTPYAAQMTTETVLRKTKDFGFTQIHILVKGPGMGRESAIRAVINSKARIKSIDDITPIPHNGCRPRKSRRV